MTPLTQDFIKGYDPTGAASISPSQLAQMVDAATPAADKGLWITTSDDGTGAPVVPDAASNTKWQTYGWRRISANTVSAYIWSPNTASNPTYLKWINVASLAFAPNTIPAASLVNNSIGDAQVAAISVSKITGLPTGLPPTGAAGGDLTGNYPSPTIGALAVNGGSAAGRIANKTINDYNIADVGITATTKLALAAANVILKMKSDASVWEVKDYITGNGGKAIRVNAGATDFEAVTPTFAKTVFSAVSGLLSVFTTAGAAADVYQVAHGLAAVPSYVHVVLQCITNDGTFVAGDEVPIACAVSNSAAFSAMFGIIADATNITVTFSTNNGSQSGIRIPKKSTPAVMYQITYASWKVKVYATI